jgi:uncharacterized protein (TIGR03000 family)
MYSLVLMAAISGGPGTAGSDQPGGVMVAPAVVGVGCGGYAGCTGCTGYMASCYGCSGCCGGGRGGLFGLRAARAAGCCGGTVAYGCGGGFLGHKNAKHGCSGSCFGSCSGFIHTSAWGNCHGCGGGVPSTYYYPAYSTPIHTGAAPFYHVGPTHSAPPIVVPPAQSDEPKSEEKKGASLKFNLPAGATLFVDGAKTAGEGTERSFFTPPLEAGQKFFYDVRAEIMIDGKSVVEEKRVVVEAGAEISESFPKMIAAIALATTVAGK